MQRLRSVGRGWVFAAAILLGACGPAPATFQPAPAATGGAIDADDLRLRVGFLASDSLRGRDTGSPGIETAARYLAAEMRRLGLRPAGDDGGYLQRVPLERRFTAADVSVTNDTGTMSLGPDAVLSVAGLGGLPAASRQRGSGPLVFGGHLVDPTVGAAELSLAQLRDAVVIVRVSTPGDVNPEIATPRVPIATLFSPVSPAAAILLVAEESETAFWEYALEVAREGSVGLAGGAAVGPTAPPFFLISVEAAERLIGAELSDARLPRTSLGTLEFALDERVEPIEGWNVAAIFPGRDPARAGEFVALGAHYDHVGVGTPVDGDSIFNGADDNASGSSALLELAEALAHLRPDDRPARSVLFAWVTAEESGLLGSEHFTDHPPIPRESIIAHLNLDMVGRNDPDSLSLVGSRRLSTELGDLVEAVNQRQGTPFIFDYTYDAPGHPEQVYCRSDHYNYARYGIPIVFLSTGLHDDYHAVSDEADLLNYDKLARVSGLVFDITRELADRPEPPRVDQPVPPLGAPCQG